MPEGVVSVMVLEGLQVEQHLLGDSQYYRREGVTPSS